MTDAADMTLWEQKLDSFDLHERRDALERLLAAHRATLPLEDANLNMHFHSFFSYNAFGYSPSRIAWEARTHGLYAAGLCDFDVLDGLEEFLDAGALLGLRATVNLETRAFLAARAHVEISSPGEPGVTYIMGAGFAALPPPASPQAAGLADIRARARRRNLDLIARVNARLPDIALDETTDVLPLTPAGAATERHIVTAYIRKAAAGLGHKAAGFWSNILERPRAETEALMAHTPAFEEAVRSRLVKKGGIGYEQPSAAAFPTAENFIRWTLACRAIPMVTWLDGISPGEEDARALLDTMRALGAAALNIIPDRNWNVADPAQRRRKIQNLDAIVRAADDLGWPINIGTEMNKLGLPFADDLDGDALRPYKASFLRGARILVGHTLLSQYADFAYVGEKAAAAFPTTEKRNAFFEAVGRLPPPTPERTRALRAMGPDAALNEFINATEGQHA